jgi:hypothetical protein
VIGTRVRNLLEPPKIWKPGDHATWLHEERGGYGYVTPVHVTVLSIGPKRIRVEAPLRAGGTRKVWVKAESLRARP